MLFWFLGIFFMLLIIGIPIAFSLGITMAVLVTTQTTLGTMIIPQQMAIGADNFTLMAIPFFILAAELMTYGGITKKIVKFVNSIIGWVTGGLALVNIGTNMLFAGLSGSSVADNAMLGSMMIPVMEDKGYDVNYAAAVNASASTMGIIIPPSIPMILLGVISGQSILKLFLGGIIPGILIGVGLMIVAYYIAKKEKYPREEKVGISVIWNDFKSTIWALLLPLIIIFGVLFGVFTVTEASVVATVYAFIAARYIYKELKWKDIPEALISTVKTTSMVMFIVATASGVAWILNSQQVPQNLAQQLSNLTTNPLIFMLIVNVFMLIVGSVMDLTPALLILGPIFYPIISRFGIDPIYFGVIFIMNLSIGLITPPVGSCLYISTGIAKTSAISVFKSIIPFLIVLIAVLLLTVFVPPITTWLPSLI